MRRLKVTALAATAIAFATSVAAAPPNTVIDESVALLVEKLDGRKEELAADRKALYALIDEILLPRFDRRFAAQLVLAKHWRTASDEQKTRFIEAFYQARVQRVPR